MRKLALALTCLLPGVAQAAQELDSGDTAWLITATALVLFMTLPGLALFYGGLVRTKNVLSVLMQCFALACVVSVIWIISGLTSDAVPIAAINGVLLAINAYGVWQYLIHPKNRPEK